MVVLMTIAAVVSIVQLALLGSWARSLRVLTLLQAAAVGFLACAPVAVTVQWLLTRGLAAVGPWQLADVVRTAGWSYDPLIEEVVKIAPLALLAWRRPRVHRQLGWVDHLLVGAALGVGFQLAEAALRYGRVKAIAMATPGGWLVDGSLLSTVTVPTVWASLTSWLPAPVSYEQWLGSVTDTVQHLIWTALAAAGIAWVARRDDRTRWLGLLPLLIVGLDHALYNGAAAAISVPFLSTVSGWVDSMFAVLLPLALVALVAADRWTLARVRAERPDLLLAGEAKTGLGPSPLFRVALGGLPWSALATWTVVLERRAALNALSAGVPKPELADMVGQAVAQLGSGIEPGRWTGAARTLWRAVDLRTLRSWRVVLWLISLLPALVYLVAGGFPATRGLQAVLTSTVGAWLVVAGLLAGGAVVASGLPRVVRRLRKIAEPALHETRLRPAGQLLTATASLASTAILLALLAVVRDPGETIVRNFHVLDALSSAELILGLALILLSFALFPPAGALVLTTAGTVVVTGSGAALAAGTFVGSSLVVHALLNQASGGDTGSSSSGSSSSRSSPQQWERDAVNSGRFTEQDLPRLRELSRDPASGGAVDADTWAEAEVGLGLEKKGLVRGLTRSPNPGEEFLDSARRAWDVKAFRSSNFNLEKAMANINRELRAGENVMLDTRHLTAEQFVKLDEALQAAGQSGRVLWWP